ncbi:putative metal-dependent hydrolase of the TIM-barrel fold protein [Variovorax sp. PBS-H4]|uniref:amidohydrolase family protein n=1 Tax=Variovorax sp. PBS-H4 TaxID=434008 RepID=UPI0013176037|nr:amidohydrolase family protein [Variovorax sp. PBS-H4]VTU36633.1 putative metal-dependent hydrolase of the TIM-barrel fold protein [Variovorax sp. PBS-H4]
MTEAKRDLPGYRGTLHRTTNELLDWQAGTLPEPALEPELPIVDAHHHLYGTPTDPHHYRLEDLERDFAGGHRIIATVYVEGYQSGWHRSGPQALRPVGEVLKIAALAQSGVSLSQGPCKLAAGIVSHADLLLGDEVAEVLEAQLEAGRGRLRGVRHAAAHEDGAVGRFVLHPAKPHLLADPVFRKGLSQVHRFGLSFDAWIYHLQLGELADLADALPELSIVLNHVGGLIGVGDYRRHRAANVARWRHDLGRLAACPNVSVKVGGMGMPVFGFGFEHRGTPPTSLELAQAWQPLIDACIEAFGAQRCMFEGNFPVDKQSCGYTELWNAFKRATRSLSPVERAALFCGTACRVYRLAVNGEQKGGPPTSRTAIS